MARRERRPIRMRTGLRRTLCVWAQCSKPRRFAPWSPGMAGTPSCLVLSTCRPPTPLDSIGRRRDVGDGAVRAGAAVWPDRGSGEAVRRRSRRAGAEEAAGARGAPPAWGCLAAQFVGRKHARALSWWAFLPRPRGAIRDVLLGAALFVSPRAALWPSFECHPMLPNPPPKQPTPRPCSHQLSESLSTSQSRLQALMSKQGRASQFASQNERDAFLKVRFQAARRG